METASVGIKFLAVVTFAGIVFLLWVLYHLIQESRYTKMRTSVRATLATGGIRNTGKYLALTLVFVGLFFISTEVIAQTSSQSSSETETLQQQLISLKHQLEIIQGELDKLNAPESPAHPVATPVASEPTRPAETKDADSHSGRPAIPVLPAGSTLNVTVDGYYGYNFNHPIGRVNSIRAYDILSNSFSLNQAAAIFELPTDVESGRRYGLRLDLQYGQATGTLQGNPANEGRPDIYRNIFQAYGRYVVPVGKGLTVDFGKWASSLGYESNYTKDQLNYSRSFYFYYLPFYHTGLRMNYPVNDKIAVNYWLTNGTQQTEPFNSFKDQMIGLAITPRKTITWNVNYYYGQEHPDVNPSSNCGSAPLQPGLCFTPINPAPDGRTHIIDSYVTWQAKPKLLFGLEGDYVIQRQWRTAGPGHSSAPSHVVGGAVYAQYQFNSRASLAGRSEYLSDRGGLFSGTTQALKEATGTFEYKFGDGFIAMAEYRRDWSNQAFFPTGTEGLLKRHQDTATIGLVWWYGGKQGNW